MHKPSVEICYAQNGYIVYLGEKSNLVRAAYVFENYESLEKFLKEHVT